METIPLLKQLRSIISVIVVPLQHLLVEFEANALAVLPDDLLGVVEHVIGIYDGDLLLIDDASIEQEIEQTDKLDVAGLTRHEVIKVGDVAQGRNSATPVGGDRPPGMADEECELELAEDGGGNGSWVSGFRTVLAIEGRGNVCGSAIRGKEIVGHIFDEGTFALERIC